MRALGARVRGSVCSSPHLKPYLCELSTSSITDRILQRLGVKTVQYYYVGATEKLDLRLERLSRIAGVVATQKESLDLGCKPVVNSKISQQFLQKACCEGDLDSSCPLNALATPTVRHLEPNYQQPTHICNDHYFQRGMQSSAEHREYYYSSTTPATEGREGECSSDYSKLVQQPQTRTR